MNLLTTLPLIGQWLPWLAALLALMVAWPGLRRHIAQADAEGLRVLLVAALALAGMRWFNTAALHGVMLHLLGASIVTLMFGMPVALWVMALVSLSGVLLGAAWHDWGADMLVAGALPVWVTAQVSALVRDWLPRNIFVYVLGNAFAAGALAMAASVLMKALVAALLGSRFWSAYLAATPLLMFAEAFSTGAVMALVVVYRPTWCTSFDDRLYLWPRRPM